MMIILIIQHPYGANDRARDEDINKPAGLRLAELKLELHDPVPATNTADATFEQIYLIIDNDIKNAYFVIFEILNTVKKIMLKQLASPILYRNNNLPSGLGMK